ncbi:hypothetical protein D3C73_775450 [compost metagenome]
MRQRFTSRRIELGDAFGQIGMVLIRPANPDPGGQRCRKATAQGPQERRQARAIGNLMRWQIREQDGQGRHKEQRHPDAHEQLHHGDVLEIHFIGETGAHETAQADGQERPAGQHPHVEFRRVFADER